MSCSGCEAPVSKPFEYAIHDGLLRPLTYGLSAYLLTQLQLPSKLSFLQLSTPTKALVSAASVAGAVDGLYEFGSAVKRKHLPRQREKIATSLTYTIPAALLTASIATFAIQRSLHLRLLKDVPLVAIGSMASHWGIGAAISTARYLWPHAKLQWMDTESCGTCGTHWDRNKTAAHKMYVAALFSGLVAAYGLSRFSSGVIKGYALPLPLNIPMSVWAGGGMLSLLSVKEKANATRDSEIIESHRRGHTIANLFGMTLATVSTYLASKRWGPTLTLTQSALVGSAAYIGGAVTQRAIDHLITDAYNLWPHLGLGGGGYNRPSGAAVPYGPSGARGKDARPAMLVGLGGLNPEALLRARRYRS